MFNDFGQIFIVANDKILNKLSGHTGIGTATRAP